MAFFGTFDESQIEGIQNESLQDNGAAPVRGEHYIPGLAPELCCPCQAAD